MAIYLTDDQTRAVAIKRVQPRPQFYNAPTQSKQTISGDFEAFLILLGRAKTKETLNWLKKAKDYSVKDGDRDSLVNAAIENELEDAELCASELAPIADDFNLFRKNYQLQGFEGVAEAGQLLSDLQRPMSEIIAMAKRQNHRMVYGNLLKASLLANGVTSEQQKQLNSWFSPLTTY